MGFIPLGIENSVNEKVIHAFKDFNYGGFDS